MKKLITKLFSKWVAKQNIPHEELAKAIREIESGSGRTIVCYKREDRVIFIHGFAKNEKSDLTTKELNAFKELAKILLSLSSEQLCIAIENGDFIEVAK